MFAPQATPTATSLRGTVPVMTTQVNIIIITHRLGV
jgi:hypothetical protein